MKPGDLWKFQFKNQTTNGYFLVIPSTVSDKWIHGTSIHVSYDGKVDSILMDACYFANDTQNPESERIWMKLHSTEQGITLVPLPEVPSEAVV